MRQAIRAIAAVCSISFAAFCAAGPSDAAAQKAAAGKARLQLTRVSGLMYSGAPASVTVNGNSVASLWAGGSSVVEIAPGPATVAVSAWSYPGSWTVKINAKAGQTYALEISPRGESFGPSLLGPIGAAIDAGQNKNAGAFQMRLVSGRRKP